MINTLDTICAISTPPGVGGIAVIRVSGPRAFEAVQKIWRGKDLSVVPHASASVGEIIDGDMMLDQAVATVFRAPRSYTSYDTVEISVHGSVYIQSRLLRLIVDTGLCRMAEPGEYTRLAYLAGRMDLAQVEAVADILSAQTAGAHNIAIHQLKGGLTDCIRDLRDRLVELVSLLELELDFSEEDVEFASRSSLEQLLMHIIQQIDKLTDSFSTGQAILSGFPIVLAGATNAGKSTLFNLLIGDDRAIVSDIHGTTRDMIQDTFSIGETLFRITDTAGLRNTSDPIEREGINRACKVIHNACLILWLNGHNTTYDEIRQIWEQLKPNISKNQILLPIITKIDTVAPGENISHVEKMIRILPGIEDVTLETPLFHTTKDSATLHTLREAIIRVARPYTTYNPGETIITNERQRQALIQAKETLKLTQETLASGYPPDLVAHHLRDATSYLATITGDITTPDILSNIFSRFCIGK